MRTSKFAGYVVSALLCVASLHASADQITILTSFPKEITDTYKKAFEKVFPDSRIEVLNKSTTAAIAYLRELPAGQRPDVFWASAPDAFEVLAAENLLQKAPEVANPLIPEKIGFYPMNDPEGMYYGQALAGYGIMWNTRYMKAHKLPEPKEWADLAKPVYFSHVAMSSPSRSGTTHLTVETILQGEGWDKGWAQLLAISGNCAAITERSFGVPDGVNNGQFGLGLVIDFFGLAGKYSGFPVEFIYPSVTAIVPANIGLIANARNAEGGKRFIKYTLSKEGQELLLDPKISRLPVLPSVYGTKNIPPDFPNVFQIAKNAKVKFDSDLSQVRYAIVSSMFDQTITFRLKELQVAAKAISEVEIKLAKKPNASAAQLLAEAKKAAFTPVLSGQESANKELTGLFKKNKKEVEVTQKISALEEAWGSKAKENYAKALELALKAATLAR